MLDRLRTSFFPQIEPELRHSRVRIARTLTSVYFGVLAIWTIGLLVHILVSRSSLPRIGFDATGILVLAVIGWGVWRLLNRGQLVSAAYLLAGTVFLLISISVFEFSSYIFVISPALLLPILVAGAIIGADSPLFFSGAAIAVATFGVYRDQGLDAFRFFELEGFLNLVYLFTFSAVAITTSMIMKALASQVQRTIGSLHRQAEQLAKLAHTDPLTGLANRRSLFEQLESEFARAKRYRRPFTLLFIDLDGFKAVNDQYGHLFGDEILRGCAMALQSVLRATDLLARIGGDEFAVLLPETTLEGGKNVTEKLRKALIAYGNQLSRTIPSLTFSVGVSEINDRDQAIEDILARADRAQYLAKTTGKAVTRTDIDLISEAETNAQSTVDEPTQ